MALEIVHVRDRCGEGDPWSVADGISVRFVDEDLARSHDLPQVRPRTVDYPSIEDEVLAIEAPVCVRHDHGDWLGLGAKGARRLRVPGHGFYSAVGVTVP